MRKASATFLWAVVLAGCEMDLIGLGDSWEWDGGVDVGGSTSFTPQTVLVSGSVAVGGYAALQGEVVVELWDPAKPEAPVDTVSSTFGRYAFDLGLAPRSDVCGYLVRGVRWDGSASPKQPLLASPPSPCTLVPSALPGTAIAMAQYPPLVEPFVIEGTVLVDGRPASASSRVDVLLRGVDTAPLPRRVEVGADGRYRLEIRDPAQRYAHCSIPQFARVSATDPSGKVEYAQLEPLPLERCGAGRVFPDIRFGAIKAASGRVYVSEAGRDRPVGAGEAWAELLRASDGAVVGETVHTLDDGSFHVWFPHEMSEPGCDWILRVTHARGGSELRRHPSSPCSFPAVHLVSFTNGLSDDAELLELVVLDPAGDQTGPSDIVEFRMRFDPRYGEYEIEIEADAAHPFVGEMRININLYNTSKSSFFSDNMNDVLLSTPVTKLRLSGRHPELRMWGAGDLVHTNSLGGTPNPTGSSLYRSGVTHIPMGFLTNEDVIAFVDVRTPAVVTSVP